MMLRKLLVMTLLSMYSLAAIGVPMHYHYCKGELQHISLFIQKDCDEHEATEKAPVSCCTAEETSHCEKTAEVSSNCCDDQSDIVQFEVDAVVLTPSYIPALVGEPVFDPSVSFGISTESDCLLPYANGPPEQQTELYLSLCSLVFYE